ncbi:NAD(P)/FAD-dependent oxidoreductase [Burkholderia sp. Ac-20353]|uniref:flavin-containing monooxygenase n=1 Tax=Burkholderia sp. Ac-20353 TaxID=2703894 RepID=UPI00197C34A2|nr:NAD(P)/FAD-dependent oxidoreductase [Burkholderia sp. Ac-20353]MBN3785962.1 NAD(P)/FAD-dependent oxidoreductase [Burkholderia sp. Ac-20353]
MTLLRRPEAQVHITERHDTDVVIVGAGFAGMYMLHKLRALGLATIVFERGDGVGGTWYWNRYPGARCDIESADYSYSFSDALQQEWRWSERYATQPEILRYVNHVADRFDLRRDIRFNTQVTCAKFDDSTSTWEVLTDRGECVRARFLILATGCLSVANLPDIPGRDAYQGDVYHTGDWPHDNVDFSGKRVAVIGTGSSAIQSIPLIAQQADRVFVLQRTPNFSVPARNAPLSDEQDRKIKQHYAKRRQVARYNSGGVNRFDPTVGALEVPADVREREYERKWREGGLNFASTFADLRVDAAANATAADFIRRKIRETVRDQKTAEMLTPNGYPFAAKRPCVDTNYYETFNRDNVTLVDLRHAPISGLTPRGVRTSTAHYDVDAIVFATGFDAMTGAIHAIDIRGRNGKQLREHWGAGPRTYLGLMSAGFPNLFIVASVGSPSVLSNMMTSIEQHVDWISACIERLHTERIGTIEAAPAAEQTWVDHVNVLSAATLFPLGTSWYMGANIPGKPRIFMPYAGGVGRYRELCERIEAQGYPGFLFDRRDRDSLNGAARSTAADVESIIDASAPFDMSASR